MARVRTLRRARTEASDGIVGPARVDRRSRIVAERAGRGDIAVIDHVDLDRRTAAMLVSNGVLAVVNASPTVSGRYPSLGATVLVDAGVELLDTVGPGVLGAVRDGDTLTLSGNELCRGDTVVASGTRQTAQTITDALRTAEAGLSTQMEAFAASAAEFVRREHHLLLEPGAVPSTRAALAGRDVIVVAPGPDHRTDLARLRGYAKEHRPAVVAVDDAADAARSLGFTPTVLVGDLSNVSDETIRRAEDIIVVLDGDGGTGGLARVDRLGATRSTFTTTAPAQDLALLVADEADARVIVTVGTDRTLVSMLDSGRAEAAADFVTRLRVGSRLVDGAAVAALHRPRVSGVWLGLLLLAGLLALGAALWLSSAGADLVTTITDTVGDVVDSLRGTSAEEPSP